MRIFLVVCWFLLMPWWFSGSAGAGTVTVTTAGFAALPATAPGNWPPAVAYPGGSSINGTHVYTVSDADMLRVLTWTAVSANPALPAAPSALQILLAWVNSWWRATASGEQSFSTAAPVPPPPINVQ